MWWFGASEDADSHPKGFVETNMAMFRRNPQLLKVLLLAGLQQAGCNLANTFVLSDMKATYWGIHQSEYQSLASIFINMMAVICGGPYGRFGDAVDRRVAVGIFGFGTFMQGWALQIFGFTNSALWISTFAQIIGSFGLSSNVMFALATDVTRFQDREVMAGAFFAACCALNLIVLMLPTLFILVLQWVPNNPNLMICVQTGVTLIWYLILCSVKGQKEQEADHHNDMWYAESGELSEGEGDVRESVPPAKRDCKSFTNALKGLFEPFRLAFGHRRLRRLCLAAFLLSFGGNLVSDIGGQFFQESLGLIDNTDMAKDELQRKRVWVAVYSMLPGQLMAIPGNLITGYLAKQSGPLRLLRRIVPVAAVLVMVGGLMAIVRQMWYIAVVVICLTYASMPPNVVLQRVVAGAAPPGRTGEALATAGVFSMLAGMLGNMGVASFNPILYSFGWPNPLWVYYPVCGLLVLLALLPLLGTPRGGWGAASGAVHDQVFALAWAGDALRRWKAASLSKSQTHSLSQEPLIDDNEDELFCGAEEGKLNLDKEIVKELRFAFEKFDRNGNGKLSSQEISMMLKDSSLDISDADIEAFVHEADVDASGELTFDEFLHILQSKQKGRDLQAELVEAFKVIDRNQDGFLAVDELREALGNMRIPIGEEELTRMFKKAGHDRHEKVSFKEFEQLIRQTLIDEAA